MEKGGGGWWLGGVIITLVVVLQAGALRLENFHVPGQKVTGEDADLFCYFRLERNRSLYTLKWFKDGMEIFRYTPASRNQIVLYWVDGVSVDGERSSMNRVHMKNLTKASTGTYSCEVTEEQSFTIVRNEAEMTVLDGPKSDPILQGFPSSLTLGDVLEGNCTLRKASPLVKLEFLINNVKPEESYLQHFPSPLPPPINMTSGREELTLRLRLPVQEKHWTRGAVPGKSTLGNYIELKCLAMMESVENVWITVKYIHEANPTLRRKSPRRQASVGPVIEALTLANGTTTAGEIEPWSSNTENPPLAQQISNLLIILNQGLGNLTAVQTENAAASKELLQLRRQELAFLRQLPKAPIRME